ncbi:MAG TPA: acetyl-CoA carboxylase biotin carboxyl carrier protein [Blastocatellia bacterium]|nr:acetyl-CoA carboxylase biotin carboxyl carrier protein [Blastocatellia bacterium]
MNQKEIRELIELVAEKEFAEFEVERSGFRMRIKRSSEHVNHVAPVVSSQPHVLAPVPPPPIEFPTPARHQAPVVSEPKKSEADQDADLHQIKSPIVGTFYRAPSPTSQPFVKIGDRVEKGAVLCIVEAMKLMNEIESEVSGTIAKIYVETGVPVEYGQALFGIKIS